MSVASIRELIALLGNVLTAIRIDHNPASSNLEIAILESQAALRKLIRNHMQQLHKVVSRLNVLGSAAQALQLSYDDDPIPDYAVLERPLVALTREINLLEA